MRIAFWVSLGLVLYAYAVYPCILIMLASFYQLLRDLRFASGRGERRSGARRELPTVSVVVSAFNEESVIREKMANCAALDYAPAKLEVIVGCDGCTDQTTSLATTVRVPNVHVLDFPVRRGKPIVLNDLVARAQGEIVVFSDANTMLAPDAVRHLVRHFQDPRVGCASGELTFKPTENGTRSEGVYWRYEVLLKFFESRLNMLVGANGGLFAIRKALFTPIPARGIIDDFLVSMSVRQQGYRAVYDPEATAVEEAAASVKDEFRRRVRIGAGNFYALRYTWRLLLPTAGLVSLAYWSHKVCRWTVPYALLTAFCAALALISEPFYTWSVAAALGLCAMGAVGYRRERRDHRPGLFGIPYYFLSMNLALGLGLLRCVSGKQGLAWNRTPREGSVGVGR